MTPEYIHLLINHFPIHGILLSTAVLIGGLIAKKHAVVFSALLAMFVCSASIPFVMKSGEDAYYRYEADPAVYHLDAEAIEIAKKHYDEAEFGAKATYLLAVISGLASIFYLKRREQLRKWMWVVAFLAIVCLGLNAWIAKSGGEIRRPDFRAPVEAQS